MNRINHAPGYISNSDYAQEDWDDVCDSPELTAEDFAEARPVAEVLPELVEAMTRRRGAQKAPTKALFSLRIDRDVLDAYRASGPGWQGRMNDALRRSIGLERIGATG